VQWAKAVSSADIGAATMFEQAMMIYRASCLDQLGISPAARDLVPPALDALLALARSENVQSGDEAMGVICSNQDRARSLDEGLRLLRDWCEVYKLEITPRNWQFSPTIYAEYLKDLNEAESRGTVCRFHNGPKRRVFLRHFGLVSRDQGWCLDCGLSVSAGESPEYYDELFQQATAGRDEFTSQMRECLGKWPEKAIKDELALQSAAADLFEKFWQLKPAWSTADADACEKFRKGLTQVLIKGLHMAIKDAKKEDIDKDWVKRRTERGNRFTPVSPALLAADGTIKVQSLVDLEE
jgi:hypothetical protein